MAAAAAGVAAAATGGGTWICAGASGAFCAWAEPAAATANKAAAQVKPRRAKAFRLSIGESLQVWPQISQRRGR
jgi:hypothetical protein